MPSENAPQSHLRTAVALWKLGDAERLPAGHVRAVCASPPLRIPERRLADPRKSDLSGEGGVLMRWAEQACLLEMGLERCARLARLPVGGPCGPSPEALTHAALARLTFRTGEGSGSSGVRPCAGRAAYGGRAHGQRFHAARCLWESRVSASYPPDGHMWRF